MAVLDSEREEATGHVRILMVAYKLPRGHVLVGAGRHFPTTSSGTPCPTALPTKSGAKCSSPEKRPSRPNGPGVFQSVKLSTFNKFMRR